MTGQQDKGIGLNDLRAVLNLIQVVTARGAVKANELTAVGELHDKISNFLEMAEKAAAAAVATKQGSTSETSSNQGEI